MQCEHESWGVSTWHATPFSHWGGKDWGAQVLAPRDLHPLFGLSFAAPVLTPLCAHVLIALVC